MLRASPDNPDAVLSTGILPENKDFHIELLIQQLSTNQSRYHNV